MKGSIFLLYNIYIYSYNIYINNEISHFDYFTFTYLLTNLYRLQSRLRGLHIKLKIAMQMEFNY